MIGRRQHGHGVWLLARSGARAEGDLVVHAAIAGEGAAAVVVRVAVGLRALRLEQPRVPARPARRRRREPPAAAVLVAAERQARAPAAHHRAAAVPRRQLARAHPVDVRRARRPLAPPAAAGAGGRGRDVHGQVEAVDVAHVLEVAGAAAAAEGELGQRGRRGAAARDLPRPAVAGLAGEARAAGGGRGPTPGPTTWRPRRGRRRRRPAPGRSRWSGTRGRWRSASPARRSPGSCCGR